MSMAALKWAREPRPGLGITARAVLRDLADRANDSGVCWPSIRTIVADTGACERSVRNALRRLEEEELVRVHRIAGRSSRYVLAVPRQNMPDTPAPFAGAPAPDAPKASISTQEAKPWLAPKETRSNAGAYRKADLNLPDVDADPAIVEQLHQMIKRWR